MTMNVSIHGINLGALVLAKTLPPQFTPRSKHYVIKTIWFSEEIFKRDIELNKINTVEQLGTFSPKVSEELFLNTSKRRSCIRDPRMDGVKLESATIKFGK
jgi:hypothetical protein